MLFANLNIYIALNAHDFDLGSCMFKIHIAYILIARDMNATYLTLQWKTIVATPGWSPKTKHLIQCIVFPMLSQMCQYLNDGDMRTIMFSMTTVMFLQSHHLNEVNVRTSILQLHHAICPVNHLHLIVLIKCFTQRLPSHHHLIVLVKHNTSLVPHL